MHTHFRINANGELIVYPFCDHAEDNVKKYFLEFLDNPDINQNDTIKISEQTDYYIYELPVDGLYTYYRLCIYDETSKPDDYDGLYYDRQNNELMFQNKILDNIVDIIPYLELGYVRDWHKIDIFSIIKLQHCLLAMQKKKLVNSYNNSCGNDSESQFMNFLFISIYVLENLIQEQRFGEAIDIVEMLSSCDFICNKNITKKSKCNCR